MLLQGVRQRTKWITVFEEQPQLAAQRLLEDDVTEGDIQFVHLFGGQPRADRRRDDRSGGGAGCQLEDLADRLAQVIFQVAQRAGDDHPADAAAVDGDRDILAKRVHGLPLLSRSL